MGWGTLWLKNHKQTGETVKIVLSCKFSKTGTQQSGMTGKLSNRNWLDQDFQVPRAIILEHTICLLTGVPTQSPFTSPLVLLAMTCRRYDLPKALQYPYFKFFLQINSRHNPTALKKLSRKRFLLQLLKIANLFFFQHLYVFFLVVNSRLIVFFSFGVFALVFNLFIFFVFFFFNRTTTIQSGFPKYAA